LAERKDLDSAELVALSPSIKEVRLGLCIVGTEGTERSEVRLAEPRASLDLEGEEPSLAVKDVVDLRSIRGAPEVKLIPEVSIVVLGTQ
jgi:hypothetical protein